MAEHSRVANIRAADANARAAESEPESKFKEEVDVHGA